MVLHTRGLPDPEALELQRRCRLLWETAPIVAALRLSPMDGGLEHAYPAWQFGPDGAPLPHVAEVLAAAREAGLDETQLSTFLDRRAGVGGPRGDPAQPV